MDTLTSGQVTAALTVVAIAIDGAGGAGGDIIDGASGGGPGGPGGSAVAKGHRNINP